VSKCDLLFQLGAGMECDALFSYEFLKVGFLGLNMQDVNWLAVAMC
jgi:hypothetical protein